jgi:radical SAM protein with 4Fe4S-binding SPASM domain
MKMASCSKNQLDLARELSAKTNVPVSSVLHVIEAINKSKECPDAKPLSLPPYESFLAEAENYYALRRANLLMGQDGKIPPEFPEHIQIQTIAGCNASCVICSMSQPETKRLQHGVMTPSVFTKILKECSDFLNCTDISFYLQNEPLLDCKLEDRIREAKDISGGRLRSKITSNAVALSPKRIDSLINCGLDSLSISLNANSSGVYREIMGIDAFSAVMANINYLLDAAPKHMTVALTFIVSTINRHEIKAALDYWRSRGVLCAAFGINSQGGALHNYEQLKPADAPERRKECAIPLTSIGILADGSVLLCCTDWRRESIVGNVRDSSLYDIWHSQKVSRFRSNALANLLDHPICQRCDGPTRALANTY